MLDQVQQKISALHTEYITLKFGQGNKHSLTNWLALTSEPDKMLMTLEYSLAKAKLFSNWVPPERPTMINILFTAVMQCFDFWGKGKKFFFSFSGFPLLPKLNKLGGGRGIENEPEFFFFLNKAYV